MTLKLNRIIEDLADPDREIQILALTTIPRIAPDLQPSPQELEQLNAQLTKLAQSRNPDIVFLARKAQNTITRFAALEPAAPPAASVEPPPSPPPAAAAIAANPALAVPPSARTDPGGGTPAQAQMSADQLLDAIVHEQDPGQLASVLAAARAQRDPRIMEKSVPMLAHPDPRVRANAVEVFDEAGAEKHLPHLLPLLHDDNNRVRSNAVKAVHRFAQPQVTACLADMLKSELVSMRESALYALSSLPEIDAWPLVRPLVDDPYDDLRLRLVAYAAAHPGKESTEILERLVLDRDAKVRDQAVEALVKRSVSVEGLLQQAARHDEAPVPDPNITPPDGISLPGDLLDGPENPASFPAGVPENMVEEAVERGFRATLSQLLRDLKSAEKRAILARALYQAGLKGYQFCRRGDFKDKEALSLYYEIDRYQEFLREYTRKLKMDDITIDKVQRQIVVSGLAQYQGRLKVTLVKLGRIAAQAAHAGTIELPADLLREIDALAPPPPSGL